VPDDKKPSTGEGENPGPPSPAPSTKLGPEPPKSQSPQPPPKKDAKPESVGPPPALDERKLKYAELLPHSGAYDVGELTGMLTDGRAVVRGNAALALAAANQAPFELSTLLRDSEVAVALSAAEALGRLGPLARSLVPQMAQATHTAKPEVIEGIVSALAELFGRADEELTAALDAPSEVANKSVIAAAKVAGKHGIGFLARATSHERSRIRINAVAGLGLLGKTDPETAMACLTVLEASDPVPDVRTAAKQSMLAVVAREKVEVVDGLPKNIPDFEARKLTSSELAEYEAQIDLDQMVFALQDGRDHVRINAARALAVKGGKAGRAANAMGLLMRDSASGVRREVAKALGKLGAEAMPAAGDLIGALGDTDSDVWEAAMETLERLGERAS
jgi:HEAT repeat protein